MMPYEKIKIIVWRFEEEDIITSSNFMNDQDNLGEDIEWEG